MVYAKKYIYQRKNWPDLVWDEGAASELLRQIRYLQGRLSGKLEALGFAVREDTMLESITAEVVESSAVEGVELNYRQVRSSMARKLGVETAGMVEPKREIDYIVDMMLDATQRYGEPLTEDRLFGWHASLFPADRSGSGRITVGAYRSDIMQVVSGVMGKEIIHYVAPAPEQVKPQMSVLLKWLNGNVETDAIVKAAIAHFRFVTIHPFDDGNGRIARALTEMMLAKAEDSGFRYYSMSEQIMSDRKSYYDILEDTQSWSGDLTAWVVWFLEHIKKALEASEQRLSTVMEKAAFWDRQKDVAINERQRRMLNKILDGFEGNLKTSKWAKIAKCSHDTALRDIEDLIGKGILKKDVSGGRSTSYLLRDR